MSLDTTLAKGVSYITDSLDCGNYSFLLKGTDINEHSESEILGHAVIQHDLFNVLVGNGLVWLFYILMGIGVFSIIFHWRSWKPIKRIKRKIWRLCSDHLVWPACLVWAIGFVTYCVGTHVPFGNNFFSVAPMAAIHATEMFLSLSDISAIHEDCHNSALFMFWFNFSHFMAVLISLVFIFRQFGFFVIEKVRLFIHAWMVNLNLAKRKKLYVFWGLNDINYALAKSIEDDDIAPKDLLFIRTFSDDESESSKFGFGRIFNMVKFKNEELNRLEELDCYTTSVFSSIAITNLKASKGKILRNRLKLTSLVRLMCYAQVHFFLLNDDTDKNINGVLNLLKDSDVNRDISEVHIYCHALKSPKTHWMETYDLLHQDDNIKIHVVDSSFLAIQTMKNNLKHHPIQFVDIDKKTATVSSSFRSMIIGFGETGKEYFKYLYEFGAFIDGNGMKSDFQCILLDSRMSELKGGLLTEAPGLKDKIGKEIIFAPDVRVGSTDFWTIVQKEISALNYLVLSLGDEDISMDAAIKICELAYKYREWDKGQNVSMNSKKLNIYVRSYHSESMARLKKIEENMNLLYAESGIKLFIFGDIKEVFTYQNIVKEVWLDQAKRYNEVYSKHELGNHSYSKEELWGKNLGFLLVDKETDRLIPRKVFTPDVICEYERMKEQNISNSLHSKTKRYLLERCEPPIINNVYGGKVNATLSPIDKWFYAASGRGVREITNTDRKKHIEELFRQSPFASATNGDETIHCNIAHEIYYAPLTCNVDRHGYITTILLNLARLEHERWVAKSLLQGLMINPINPCKKETSRKYHTDLCEWDVIRGWDDKKNTDTQGYDCLVVEVTLDYERGEYVVANIANIK